MPLCKSCDVAITWVTTKSGARMPIDLAMAPGGNIEIRDDGVALVVRGEPGVKRYVSHYTTCPDAAKYRKAAGVKLLVQPR